MTLGMPAQHPIAPNDSMTPGEMIEAAEHKVDSVSLRMQNDSFQQH